MSTPETDILAGVTGKKQPTQSATSPESRVIGIARERGIPDDIANDYLKVTGGVESGNRQYRADGSVLTGPTTKRGGKALGMGQVMPDQPGGTVRTINGQQFDLTDPDQNVAAGLTLFHAGGPDPVGRRLEYFGGQSARKHYERTGQIPEGGDGYTSFSDYVRKSGGYGATKSKAPDPALDLSAGAVNEFASPQADLAAGAATRPETDITAGAVDTPATAGQGPVYAPPAAQETPDNPFHRVARTIPTYGSRLRRSTDTENIGEMVAPEPVTVTYNPQDAAVLPAGTRIVPGQPQAPAASAVQGPATETKTFTPGKEYVTSVDAGDRFYDPQRTDEFAPWEDPQELARRQAQPNAIDQVSNQVVAKFQGEFAQERKQRALLAQRKQRLDLARRQVQEKEANLVNRGRVEGPGAFNAIAEDAENDRAKQEYESARALFDRAQHAYNQILPTLGDVNKPVSERAPFHPPAENPFQTPRAGAKGNARSQIRPDEDQSSEPVTAGRVPTPAQMASMQMPLSKDSGNKRSPQRPSQPAQSEEQAKASIRQMVIARSGGEETIARIKSDYQKVGRDTGRIDRSIDSQVEAEYHRQQLAQMSDQDRAEIQAKAEDLVNLPSFMKGINVGLDKTVLKLPAAAAGMIRLVGDITGNESIKTQATLLSKEVVKRAAAQEKADKSLGGVNYGASVGTQLVGDVVQIVALTSVLGPEVTMGGSGGLESLGHGESYAKAAGATLKGGVYGTMFKYLPLLEKYPQAKTVAEKIVNLSRDVAAVGAGSYAIERASGATHSEALKVAATNSAASGVMRLTQIVPDLPIVKKAVEAVKAKAGELAEPIVLGENTPEWLRQRLSKLTKVENIVFHTEDGRAISVYGDPTTEGFGGTEISFKKNGQYGDRPAVKITPEQFDELSRLVKSTPPERFGGTPPDRQLPPEAPGQITETASPGEARPPRTRPPVTPEETARAQEQAREENKQQALKSLARANTDNVPEDVTRFMAEARKHGATTDEIDSAFGRGPDYVPPVEPEKPATSKPSTELVPRKDAQAVREAMADLLDFGDEKLGKSTKHIFDPTALSNTLTNAMLGVTAGDGAQVASQLQKAAQILGDAHDQQGPLNGPVNAQLQAVVESIQEHVSDDDALAHVERTRKLLEAANKPTTATLAPRSPGAKPHYTTAQGGPDPFLDAAIERGLIDPKTLKPASTETPVAQKPTSTPERKTAVPEGGPIRTAIGQMTPGAKGVNALSALIDRMDENAANPVDVLTDVHQMGVRLDNMDSSAATGEVRTHLDTIRERLKADGYETDATIAVGAPYEDGMKAIVSTFTNDSSLPAGEERIVDVLKPAIMKDGKLVRAATVIVAKNYGTEEAAKPTKAGSTGQPIEDVEKFFTEGLVKRGIPRGAAEGTAQTVVQAIEAGDTTALKSHLHPGNKNARALFEEYAGVDLGKTQKSTDAAIDAWKAKEDGFAPETGPAKDDGPGPLSFMGTPGFYRDKKEVIDGVEYNFYEHRDGTAGVMRIRDLGTGNVLQLIKGDAKDTRETYDENVDKARKMSRPAPTNVGTPTSPPTPAPTGKPGFDIASIIADELAKMRHEEGEENAAATAKPPAKPATADAEELRDQLAEADRQLKILKQRTDHVNGQEALDRAIREQEQKRADIARQLKDLAPSNTKPAKPATASELRTQLATVDRELQELRTEFNGMGARVARDRVGEQIHAKVIERADIAKQLQDLASSNTKPAKPATVQELRTQLAAVDKELRTLNQGRPVAEDVMINDGGSSLRKLEAQIQEQRNKREAITQQLQDLAASNTKPAKPATASELRTQLTTVDRELQELRTEFNGMEARVARDRVGEQIHAKVIERADIAKQLQDLASSTPQPSKPRTPSAKPPTNVGTPTSTPPSNVGTPTSAPASNVGTPTSGVPKAIESADYQAKSKALIDLYGPDDAPTFAANEPDDKATEPIFFSNLLSTLAKKMPASAPVEQVQGIINNPQAGITKDEIKWTGLDDWLNQQSGSVTRDQVLAFVSANRVRVSEVDKNRKDWENQPVGALPDWHTFREAWMGEVLPPTEDEIDAARENIAALTGQDVDEIDEDDVDLWSDEGERNHIYHYSHPLGERETSFQVPFRIEGNDENGYSVEKEVDLETAEGLDDAERAHLERMRRLGGESWETWTSDDGLISFGSLEDAKDAIYQALRLESEAREWDAEMDGSEPPSKPQYEKYTLPGGEDYHELLMRWDGPWDGMEHEGYTSGHWDETDIIGTTRFKTRIDGEGRRGIVLEEVQSDLHQAGRDRGYTDKEGQGYLAELRDLQRQLMTHGTTNEQRKAYFKPGTVLTGPLGTDDTVIAYYEGTAPDHVDWSVTVKSNGVNGERPRSHSTDPGGVIANQINKLISTMEKRPSAAPFRTLWPELVMKRMIRWAAEHDFEWLGWTTGAQQNKRYSLSTVVEGIAYSKHAADEGKPGLLGGEAIRSFLDQAVPGFTKYATDSNLVGKAEPTYNVLIQKKNSEVYGPLFGSADRRVTESDLPKYFGKEVAARMVANEGRKAKDLKYLEADDLEVNSGGMTEFYDRQMPRFARKYIKKWGAEVGSREILAEEGARHDSAVLDLKEAEDWLKADPKNSIYRYNHRTSDATKSSDYIRSVEELHRVLQTHEGSLLLYKGAPRLETVHALPITKSMRDSVMQGQPMFVRAPQGWDIAGTGEKLAPTFEVDGNKVKLDNLAGVNLLTDAYRELGLLGKHSSIGGVHEASPSRLITGLKALVEKKVKGARQLLVGVERAAASSGSGIVVYSNPKMLAHEQHHETSSLSRRPFDERHADIDGLIRDPTFHKMLRSLLRMNYGGASKGLMVEEAAAFIAQGSYDKLGITRDEALDWIEKWYKSFFKKNPHVTVADFRESSNEAKAAREKAYAAQGNRPVRSGEAVQSLQGERSTRVGRGPPVSKTAQGQAAFSRQPLTPEERYQQAKALYNDLLAPYADQGLRIDESVRALMRSLREKHSLSINQIERMTPDLVRYMEEIQANEHKAHGAATSPHNDLPDPTPGQIKANNYKQGHPRYMGLPFTIEHPEGSTRSGEDPNGKKWSITMKSHYGKILNTEGADGEHIDAYVRPDTHPDYDGPIYVVNQVKGNGHFDEHKVMIGWPTLESAREGYAENYTKGWKVGEIVTFDDPEQFKDWLKTEDQTKPAVAPADPDEALIAQIKKRHPHSDVRAWAKEMRVDNRPGTVTAALEHAARLGADPARSDDLYRLGDYLDAIEEDPEYRASEAKIGNVSATDNEVDGVPIDYGTIEAPNVPALGNAFSASFMGGMRFQTINDARAFASNLLGGTVRAGTLAAKHVDEAVELGVVKAARAIVRQGLGELKTYRRLVNLYQNQQPNLGVRTSTSVANQAYSTPVPLAYLGSRLLRIGPNTKVLESTAGNGMLLIEAEPENVTANELNPDRVANLQDLFGADRVTSVNAATELAVEPKSQHVIYINPPFGGTKDRAGNTITYDINHRYSTNEVDHAIAMETLKAMKDDGRAILIVGGVNSKDEAQRSRGYSGKAKLEFYVTLYGEYNVVDHFTVDGDLYKKQGAGWPVDVIVINGRGKSGRTLPAADVPRIYESWNDLEGVFDEAYRKLLDASAVEQRPQSEQQGSLNGGSGQGNLPAGAGPGDLPGSTGRPPQTPNQPGTGAGTGISGTGGDTQTGLAGSAGDTSAGSGNGPRGSGASGNNGAGQLPGNADNTGNAAGDLSGPHSRGGRDVQTDGSGDLDQRPDEQANKPRQIETGQTQALYVPRSQAPGFGTYVPLNMRDAIEGSLDRLVARVGSLDAFLERELGYEPGTLPNYFGAEQIDAAAMAIDQMQHDSGFIIGDQGGIGKGRVVAAVIRWGLRQNKNVIFVTEKPNLYKDIVRDLVNIGEGTIEDWETRGLMTNQNEAVPLDDKDEDDKSRVLLFSNDKHNTKLEELIKANSIDPHDTIFTTYNQMQTVAGARTVRHDFLQQFGEGAIIIFDESHNAGGAEKPPRAKKGQPPPMPRSEFVRALIARAGGVFYSSATYAKRPQVMDLYSKTDMRLAVDNISQLAAAIERGGVPLQQAVAAMLAQAGQMIRRERDLSGLVYETTSVPLNKEKAENTSAVMRAINEFDRAKQDAVTVLDDEVKTEGAAISEDGSTGGAGAESTNFTSLMHNLVGQMVLMLKIDGAIDETLKVLEADQKAVLTVSNTMGSFIKKYAADYGLKPGDAIGLSFGDMLKRYLERSREVRIKRPFSTGPKEVHYLTDEELGPKGLAAYEAALELIVESDWTEMPVSPIDWFHYRLKNTINPRTGKGYVTGEITGRGEVIEYTKRVTGGIESLKPQVGRPAADPTDNPTRARAEQMLFDAHYRKRPGKETSMMGRIRTLVGFNGGKIDALIINQAGSTGLSIHASKEVKDQRKRVMLIAQPELNIDTHMQMLYRVDRTGQVVKPSYQQLVGDIPAEKRPAAVLSKKMASLNANTTASKDSAYEAEDAPDFMNEYGDEVFAQYMEDNPEIHDMLENPLGSSTVRGQVLEREGATRIVTGRMPLLPHADQERIYAAVEREYKDLIQQLDAMGENALEAKTLDLDAKLLKATEVSPSKGPSPFQTAVTAEEVDVKRLGKPYKPEQVLRLLNDTLGTESTTFPEVQRDGRRKTNELIENVRAASQSYIRSVVDALEDPSRQTAERTKLVGVHTQWAKRAGHLAIGATVKLNTPAGQVFGVVTKVEQRGTPKNPAALGTWRATFAVADGMRAVTLPFSKLQYAPDVAATTDTPNQYSYEPETHMVVYDKDKKRQNVPIFEGFEHRQTQSREHRVIMTGNMLAAFARFAKGRIINFSDDKGMVRQGILMPADFNLQKALDNESVSFKHAEDVITFLSSGSANSRLVTTPDNTLRISWSHGSLRLATNRSRATGGQYFLNQRILDAAGREFVQSGANMQMFVDSDRAADVINAIFAEGFQLETNSFKEEAKRVKNANPKNKQDDGQAGMIRFGGRGRGNGYPTGPGKLRDLYDRIRGAAAVLRGKSPKASRTFSVLGNLRDIWTGELSQLERANRNTFDAALRAAGAKTTGKILMRRAANQIQQILGTKDGWDLFRTALVEGRLRGVKDRWLNLRDLSLNLGDDSLTEFYAGGDDPEETGIRSIVKMLEEMPFGKEHKEAAGFEKGDSLAGLVDSLLASGDYEAARIYLSQLFDGAASRVASVMDPDDFDTFTTSRIFNRARAVYKDLLERPMSDAHSLNEGIFSDAVGPLDTYYPLTAIDEDGNLVHRIGMRVFRGTEYRAPDNPRNKMATGLSPSYDVSPEALGEAISQAERKNTVAHLLRTAEREGLVVTLKKNEAAPKELEIMGRLTAMKTVAKGKDRILFLEGKTIHVPAPRLAVPVWLYKELRPILEEGEYTQGAFAAFASRLNLVGMAGPIDAAAHTANIIGATIAGTPFVGFDMFSAKIPRYLGGKVSAGALTVAGNWPMTKILNTWLQIAMTDPWTDDAVKDIEAMSKMGLIPSRYGTIVSGWLARGREFAGQTGAEKKYLSLAPLLYGPGGIDIRARLMMYRLANSIAPHATSSDIRNFVNQLGNYNFETMGRVERFLKQWGISPFYTAGSTMWRLGIKATFGLSPLPTSHESIGKRSILRIAMLLSGGIVGMLGQWVLMYKAYTGKWPWEDEKSRLLQFPLSAEHRAHWLAQKVFGAGTSTAYVNMGYFSPLLDRGLRATGFGPAFNAIMQGATKGQAAEEAEREIFNSAVHPFVSGPLTHAAIVAGTTKEPYITGLRDFTGRRTINLLPGMQTKEPGMATLKARGIEGVAALNSFYSDLARNIGLVREALDLDPIHSGAGNNAPPNPWLKMGIDLAFPRLIKGTADVPAQQARYEKAAKATESAVRSDEGLPPIPRHTRGGPKGPQGPKGSR